MSTMTEGGEVSTVAMEMQRAVTPSRLTTTLYDLMAALQDVVGSEDDALVVATMMHLLQSGRLTWQRTDRALRSEAHGAVSLRQRRCLGRYDISNGLPACMTTSERFKATVDSEDTNYAQRS